MTLTANPQPQPELPAVIERLERIEEKLDELIELMNQFKLPN